MKQFELRFSRYDSCGLTFNYPGMGSEGGLRLLHEAAGQQLERALLEAVHTEDALPYGADLHRVVHRLPRPKQHLQQCTRVMKFPTVTLQALWPGNAPPDGTCVREGLFTASCSPNSTCSGALGRFSCALPSGCLLLYRSCLEELKHALYDLTAAHGSSLFSYSSCCVPDRNHAKRLMERVRWLGFQCPCMCTDSLVHLAHGRSDGVAGSDAGEHFGLLPLPEHQIPVWGAPLCCQQLAVLAEHHAADLLQQQRHSST